MAKNTDKQVLDELFEIEIDDRPIYVVDQVCEVCAIPKSAQQVMDLSRLL